MAFSESHLLVFTPLQSPPTVNQGRSMGHKAQQQLRCLTAEAGHKRPRSFHIALLVAHPGTSRPPCHEDREAALREDDVERCPSLPPTALIYQQWMNPPIPAPGSGTSSPKKAKVPGEVQTPTSCETVSQNHPSRFVLNVWPEEEVR